MPDLPSQRQAFVRFLLVGGTFSLFFSVATAALIRFAATPPLATSVIVYVLCIPAVFQAHKRFAFGVQHARKSAFFLYLATQVCSLTFVAAITTRFVTQMFWPDTALFLATSAIAAVLSYLIGRYITFAPR
jgi:putative flippase GtrA